MRVLVVAATEFEVESLKSEVKVLKSEVESLKSEVRKDSRLKTQDFELLITGVGMVATAFALGRRLASDHYDLVINLGIAGSFDREIALGEVVEVVEDTFSELGAEDDETFLTIDSMGFGEGVFNSTYALSSSYTIKKVSAITVNTVHGNIASIKKLTGRIQPQLESMEGAAVFFACKHAGVPCVQIRAVSNYVEKRNRNAWQIGLAIKNLNNFAVEFINKLIL